MLSRTLSLYKESFSGLSKDIWLLAIVTLINRSGTMVVPFLTLYFSSELGFTLMQAGILMALFGGGGVLAMWLGGILTDKYGYYPVIIGSFFFSGISFWSLQYLEAYIIWCIAMPIVGLITDIFRPANMAAIGAYSKPENRTRSLTLVRLAINLGFAIGPGAAGLISATIGFEWLFRIDAVTCIFAVILFMRLLENIPLKQLQEQEAKAEEGQLATFQKADSPLQDKIFTGFNIIMFFVAVSFLQFLYTLPVYFEQGLGISKAMIGVLLGFNGGLIFLIEMQVIYVLEKKGKPLRLISIASFLFMLSFVAMVFTEWQVVSIITMFLLTIGEIISFPFTSTFALSRAKPENRGAFMGAYGLPWSFAAVMAPLIGMWVAENWSFQALWGLMTLFCGIATIGMAYLHKMVEQEKAVFQEKKSMEKVLS